MAPETAAAAAVGMLVPYFKKAMEEFSGEAGKAVFEGVRGLWGRVVKLLEPDPQASGVATRFQTQPETFAAALTEVLREKLRAQPELLGDLIANLHDIRAKGPSVRVVQEVDKAVGISGVQADAMKRGTVEVTQRVRDAQQIEGAKFGTLG